MRKLFNFTWFLTFIGFFAALLLSYAYLPEQVGIHTNYQGEVDEFIGRETFFYVGLVAFILSNLVYFFSIKLLEGIPAASSLHFRNERFKESIVSWLVSFAAVINLFFILGITYIALFNTQGGDFQMSRFSFLIYIAPVLGIGCVLWLIFIFLNRHNQPALE